MQKTFEELALMWSENKQSIVKYSTLCAYRGHRTKRIIEDMREPSITIDK